MAALSVMRKAKGLEPVAWASTSPMAAPWEKATTRWPGWAAAIRSMAPRMRVQGHRVAVGHLLAVEATFPVAQVYFSEVWLNDWGEPAQTDQRRRRLNGAAQDGDVQRVEMVLGQASTDQFGLFLSDGRERGIAMPFDEFEVLPLHGIG